MIFEIHITIECESIDKFILDCEELKVKPIIIDTLNINNNIQVMTSSVYKSEDYLNILYSLKNELINKGYKIIREKVEKKPSNICDDKFIYYETHFRLKLLKNTSYENLFTIIKNENFHVSRNLFKSDNNYDYRMITYRTKNKDISEFNMIVINMEKILNKLNILYDKVELEECILDTNEVHDNNWLRL